MTRILPGMGEAHIGRISRISRLIGRPLTLIWLDLELYEILSILSLRQKNVTVLKF